MNFCRYSCTASACGSVESSSSIKRNIFADSVRVKSCETISGLELAWSAVRFNEDEAQGLLCGLVGPVAPSKVGFEENVTFLFVTIFVVLV